MTDPPLKVTSEPACFVRIVGDVDLHNAGEVAAALDQPTAVIVDLSRVGFIDSTGMAALAKARRRHEERGTACVLYGVRGMPRRSMELMGLGYLFSDP